MLLLRNIEIYPKLPITIISCKLHIIFATTLDCIILSSPEPKTHRRACSICRQPASIRPSVRRQYFQTTSPLKLRGRFLSYFTKSIYRSANEKLCFCSSWIKTLDAMATYSFHRLIIGKEKLPIFSVTMWKLGFCSIFIFIK